MAIFKEFIKDITNKQLFKTLLSYTENVTLDYITITITVPMGYNGNIDIELEGKKEKKGSKDEEDYIKKDLDKVLRAILKEQIIETNLTPYELMHLQIKSFSDRFSSIIFIKKLTYSGEVS